MWNWWKIVHIWVVVSIPASGIHLLVPKLSLGKIGLFGVELSWYFPQGSSGGSTADSKTIQHSSKFQLGNIKEAACMHISHCFRHALYTLNCCTLNCTAFVYHSIWIHFYSLLASKMQFLYKFIFGETLLHLVNSATLF